MEGSLFHFNEGATHCAAFQSNSEVQHRCSQHNRHSGSGSATVVVKALASSQRLHRMAPGTADSRT